MSKTNFEMTTEFNAIIGQGVADKPRVPSLAQSRLRISLITEEAVNELSAALDNRDLVAVADAIGDALVVVYGAANDCGLDADVIFAEIHRSNMSKLCLTEADAQYAVEQYAAGNGFHGKMNPIQASYRPCTYPGYEDQFVVFDVTTGKSLKSPTFFEPALGPIVYPNGQPVDPFPELRVKAAEKLKGEELWVFNEQLDLIAE